MVRLLFFLIALFFILSGVLFFRHYKESYKILPGIEKEELVIPKFNGWQQFKSQDESFVVDFPAKAIHTQEMVLIPNTELFLTYNMYIAEDGSETTCMVSVIDYPNEVDTSNSEAILENIMDEMMTSDPTNKIRSFEFGEFDGHQDLDFFIKSSQFVVVCKTFLVGKRLYLLTLIDTLGGFDEEEYDYFIRSFRLL